MKIAHLSDLHFTNFFRKNNLEKIEYLLKYALRHDFDHLIISGDLTHNADPEDFEILRKTALDAGSIGTGLSGSGPSVFSLCRGMAMA